MRNSNSTSFSLVSVILCAILLSYSGSVFYPRWQNEGGEAQLSWDAGGYYWYLPSVFVYHDLKGQSFKDSVLQKYTPTPPNDFQYAFKQEASGNYIVRYTMGTALLELPSFLIAHAIAKPLGYDADGFSKPYQFMVYLGGLIFALLGLWYLRKLLLHYFEDKIVAITLFLLVFGTNYLNYAGIDIGMTHTWLFTLYVLLLLNSHNFYHTFKSKYALRIGLIVGLIGLVRPPEIISIIIPFTWGIHHFSIPAFRSRIQLLLKHKKVLLIAAFICVAILSLPFLYWKWASGNWFVYTYQDQGFSWLAPNFKKYALNYQCGWLLYTPLMFFVIFGIFIFAKKGFNKVAILSLIIINYYIVASWNGWDYGGRAMVQNYPILLFPLAFFIQFIWSKKWLKWICLPLLTLCIYFNLWWTYQAHRGTLIGSVPATKAYYWNTIFKYDVPLDYQKLRDNEDEYLKPVKQLVLLYENPLKDSGNNALLINSGRPDSFCIKAPTQKYKYLRATANFSIEEKEWNVWNMTQFFITLRKGKEIVKECSIHVHRLLNRQESKIISIDAHAATEDFDNIQVIFKNDNDGTIPCKIENLKIYGFDE